MLPEHLILKSGNPIRAEALRIRLAPGLDLGAIRGWVIVTPLPKPPGARMC